MTNNVVKIKGTTSANKQGKGGSISINYAVKGIVKNVIDANRSGRIQVFISDFGAKDENAVTSWTTVSYMSPFFGITQGDNGNGSSGEGSFKNNHHSYGFWAVPPDIGTEVICIFLNGKQDFGYYIGCIPKVGLHHMVPGIGASSHISSNSSEADSYGGATALPVVEWNDVGNDELSNFLDVNRPVHSAVAGQLQQQGLLRDPIRGAISSSSMRETPSRVFGISTPGRPIYKGGLGDGVNDTAIAEGIPKQTDSNLKVTSRRGGHSFVMDDGSVEGQNQLIRLRTSSGHQITMSDDGQTLFVIHANGQSYVELGKEGTVDIYSMNSFNVRSQGDINFHADNNVNIHAEKKLNIYAEQINIQSDKETNIRIGSEFTQHTVGDHTLKVDKGLSMNSTSDASLASSATTYINGSVINLNTGATSLNPEAVKSFTKTSHVDTLSDSSKGWVVTPGKLNSITSRAPAHTPWANANLGVDVQVKASASDSLPSPPSAQVDAVNSSVPTNPKNPTYPAVAATVPSADSTGELDKGTTQAIISQQAVTVANGPAKDAVSAGSGVVDINGTKQAILGKLGQTPTQLEQAGIIKPGSAALANSLVAKGKTVEEALPPSLFTGKDGVNSVSDYVQNPKAQVSGATTIMENGYSSLKSSGIITGKESQSSVGGLLSSSLTHGSDATIGFVKGLGTTTQSTSTGAKISSSITDGNYAANLNEKSMSSTGTIGDSIKKTTTSIIDNAKNAASKGFDAVKSVFKGFSANKPVNLTVATAENDPNYKPAFVKDPATGRDVRNFSDAELAQMKSNNSELNKTLTASMGLQPGGSLSTSLSNEGSALKNSISTSSTSESSMSALTSPANNLGLTNGSGLKSLTNGAPDLSALAGAPSTENLPVKLPQNAQTIAKSSSPTGTTLSSVTSPGLGLGAFEDGLASLGSFVNKADPASSKPNLGAIPKGGENSTVLPTFAVDTVDRTELNSLSKSLLGPGVALPITSGGALNVKPLSAESSAKYDTLKKELDDLDKNKKWDLQTAKNKAEKKYGADSAEYASANQDYKDCIKRIEDIRKEMYSLTTGQ